MGLKPKIHIWLFLMSDFQLLADEHCELVVGGNTGVASLAGRDSLAANTELLSRNNTELLSRNNTEILSRNTTNIAGAFVAQGNFGVSAGVGVFLGVGAATQEQSNTNTVAIQQSR
jgi:hypothetical protein